MRWLTAVAAVAIVFAAAPAHADGKRVMVVSPSVDDASAGGVLAAKISGELVRVAKRAGDRAELSRAPRGDMMMLAGCADMNDSCARSIAGSLGVTVVHIAEVAKSTGGASLTIRTVRAGKVSTKTYPLTGTDDDALVNSAADAVAADFGAKAATTDPIAADPVDKPPEIDPKPVAGSGAAPDSPPITDPRPTPAPGPGPSPRDDGFAWSSVRPLSWAVASSGVVLVALGGVLLSAASSKEDDIKSAPTDTVEDLRRLRDLEDEGDTLKTWGAVSTIAGVAALGAGIFLIVRDGRRGKRERSGLSIVPLAPGSGAPSVGATVLYGGQF